MFAGTPCTIIFLLWNNTSWDTLGMFLIRLSSEYGKTGSVLIFPSDFFRLLAGRTSCTSAALVNVTRSLCMISVLLIFPLGRPCNRQWLDFGKFGLSVIFILQIERKARTVFRVHDSKGTTTNHDHFPRFSGTLRLWSFLFDFWKAFGIPVLFSDWLNNLRSKWRDQITSWFHYGTWADQQFRQWHSIVFNSVYMGPVG